MKRNVLLMVLVCAISACTQRPGEASPEDMTVDLAYATIPHAALVHIALEKGYFAAQGLTVNPRAFDFGKLALASVFSGKSDLATCADTPIVVAALEGKALGIMAVIATSDRTTALVADRSSGIEHPADLTGKTIGVTKGTSAEFFLELLLLARGVDRTGINIVDMMPAELLPALQDGRIQAATAWSPYLLQLQEALAVQAVTMYGEDFYTEQFYIAGGQEFIQTHPKAMEALMKSFIEAENYIIREPEDAYAIISRHMHAGIDLPRSALSQFRFRIYLDGSAITMLEEETRWAESLSSLNQQTMPDYMQLIRTEALSAIAPDRVRIIR